MLGQGAGSEMGRGRQRLSEMCTLATVVGEKGWWRLTAGAGLKCKDSVPGLCWLLATRLSLE